jgi:hypothetical protein
MTTEAKWWIFRNSYGGWGQAETLVQARKNAPHNKPDMDWHAVGLSDKPESIWVDAMGVRWSGTAEGERVTLVEERENA